MTAEQERWAEALAIDKLKGADAPVYIAERIGKLALLGDKAGVERFRAIASRVAQLRPGTRS